jgi:hypothetical protein
MSVKAGQPHTIDARLNSQVDGAPGVADRIRDQFADHHGHISGKRRLGDTVERFSSKLSRCPGGCEHRLKSDGRPASLSPREPFAQLGPRSSPDGRRHTLAVNRATLPCREAVGHLFRPDRAGAWADTSASAYVPSCWPGRWAVTPDDRLPPALVGDAGTLARHFDGWSGRARRLLAPAECSHYGGDATGTGSRRHPPAVPRWRLE